MQLLCDLTRKLCAGRTQALPYLILLHAEFSCFHSASSLKASRSRLKDHSCGHSLCSTVPHLAVEGSYPLRGHVVTGLDVSTEAIDYAQKHYGTIRGLKYQVGDLFTYDDNRFDLCYEHTAFCAIPPHRRKEMIQTWLRLLEPQGHLLGIFFVTPQRTGPPYGCSEWELRALLEKKFRLLYWKRWQHSPGKRQGTELVIYAQKKD